MRKALILFTTAALVAGSALTGSAIARDRTDRAELPANQIADQADARTARINALARACQVRNGLMVAMLAFCPIRPKNFAALEIGRNFVNIKGSWWIVLSASETKERRPDERRVNELLHPSY